MGGLVVEKKKTYTLGQLDRWFAGSISSVTGIVSLATHRGSQYAKILSRILAAGPILAPPKEYVCDGAELADHSGYQRGA